MSLSRVVLLLSSCMTASGPPLVVSMWMGHIPLRYICYSVEAEPCCVDSWLVESEGLF